MIAKVLCFTALVAATVASNYGYGKAYSAQKIIRYDGHPEIVKGKDGYSHEYIDYYAYPKYEFEYKVEDLHTGDIKAQQESRDGDRVSGYYTLKQPDGSERNVHYKSDDHTGFQADVKYETHHLRKYEH